MAASAHLWTSCSQGDFPAVQSALSDLSHVDVNHQDADSLRTPLYRAAGHGHVDIVRLLLRVPGIRVNLAQKRGATPLLIAAQQGHVEVVTALLEDPRVDPAIPDEEGIPPFFFACQAGKAHVVKEMLQDPRVDPAWGSKECSPLTISAQVGSVSVVRLLLGDPHVRRDGQGIQEALGEAGEGGHVDCVKVILGLNCKVDVRKALERLREGRRRRGREEDGEDEKDEEERRRRRREEAEEILARFEREPRQVRAQCWRDLQLGALSAADLFALTVYTADGYLRVKKGSQKSEEKRFFNILLRLPMELQMRVSNLACEHDAPMVSVERTEASLRKYGALMTAEDKEKATSASICILS